MKKQPEAAFAVSGHLSQRSQPKTGGQRTGIQRTEEQKDRGKRTGGQEGPRAAVVRG